MAWEADVTTGAEMAAEFNALQESLLSIDGFQRFRYRPGPNSSSLTGDGSLVQTATGTATAIPPAVTNLRSLLPCVQARAATPATNAVAGFRSGSNAFRVGRSANAPGGFAFSCIWGPAEYSMPATHRAGCGLLTLTAAPTDVEPSSLVNGIWMGWDAADSNIQIMHNDANGAATKIDLGASFAVPSGTSYELYLLELDSPNELTQSVDYRVVKFDTTGTTILAEASGTIITDLPTNNVLLNNRVWASAGGTSVAIAVGLYGVDIGLKY